MHAWVSPLFGDATLNIVNEIANAHVERLGYSDKRSHGALHFSTFDLAYEVHMQLGRLCQLLLSEPSPQAINSDRIAQNLSMF